MKKSDAVKKLQEILATGDGYDELDANAVLAFIENGLGMLPPFSSKAAAKSNHMDAAGYEWENE